MVAGERIERSPNAYETFHQPLIVTRKRIGSGQLSRTTVTRSSGVGSPIELGRNGALCQNRTDLSDLQDRRIASNAYRAKIGADAGNRTRVCRLPCGSSATELHRLERVAGNDPASSVWKTEALPLDDTRLTN
jgi:hypothetical protein